MKKESNKQKKELKKSERHKEIKGKTLKKKKITKEIKDSSSLDIEDSLA